MNKFICLLIVLVVGLAWPVYGQGEDDIWLNEVYVDHDSALRVSVELVGRPKDSGADAPRQMNATLTFYVHNEATAIEHTLEFALKPDEEWADNYVDTAKDKTGYHTAFTSAGVGGAVLSFTKAFTDEKVEKRYCWGAGASTGSIIGEAACQHVVRPETMHVADDANSKGSALYGGPNGVAEGDFEWKKSTTAAGGDKDFSSIGELNTCTGDGNCDHEDQSIKAWSFTDVTRVWLNEVDFEDETVTIEMVGRPQQAANMNVAVRFYIGSDPVGRAPVAATLVADSKFAGNYAIKIQVDDVGDAFPPGGGLAGMVLTDPNTVSIVYCWGIGAGNDPSSVGGKYPCGRTVRSRAFFPSGSFNSALYNRVKGTEGLTEKDFGWAESKHSDNTHFSTLGEINACDSECDHEAQVLAPYAEEVTPPLVDHVVWINEVDAVGVADAATLPTVQIEFAGRPKRQTGDPPATVEAKLTFYDGESSLDEMSVVLRPESSGGWKGNYVGVTRDAVTVPKAFPRGKVGGVKIEYEDEKRVYCWGNGAKVGDVVGDLTIECEVVVSDEEMNAADKRTNVALWNRDDTGYEGKGEGDFEWAMSVDDDDKEFHTIGDVNVCSNCEDLNDQVLAEFDWKPVDTVSSTQGTSGSVAHRGVATAVAGLTLVLILGAM